MPTPTTLPTSGLIAGTSTGHVTDHVTIHGAINSLTVLPLSTKTGNYTLALSDSGEVVEFNLGTPLTVTVPPNSSAAFPVGTVIGLCRYGAGTLAVAPGSGVTVRPPAGSPLTARVQYSELSLRKRATNEWILSGDLG